MSLSDPRSLDKPGQAILYSDSTDRDYILKVRLAKEGYQVIVARSLDVLITLCRRHRPDFVVIRSTALPPEVVKILKKLVGFGMNFSSYPTFLLVRGHVAKFLTPLLEIGLEDIIDFDDGLETLIGRLKDMRTRSNRNGSAGVSGAAPKGGSHGNLSDMSIIDLLQALGPSQRTARITVARPGADPEPLVLYLNRGNITFAKLGPLEAEKAVYEALAWEAGTWSLEPITEQDIPEPNNNLPNEFILMEGCRLIDERSRQAESAG